MTHYWRRRELTVELERLIDERGREPSRDTMKMWGRESPVAYDQVFGSFAAALAKVRFRNEEGDRPNREALISELQRLDFMRNGMVSRYHLYGDSAFAPSDYDEEFGSFRDGLVAAGIIDEPEEADQHSTGREVIADIQRVAYDFDGELTVREYIENGEYSFSVIREKWSTWRQALRAADVIATREDYTPGREELIEDILRVSEIVEGRPTRDEYVEFGGYSIQDINEQMGWSVALALADFDPPTQGRAIDRADLEVEYQRLTKKLGHTPSRDEMHEYGKYSPTPYRRVFGSWKEACEQIAVEGYT